MPRWYLDLDTAASMKIFYSSLDIESAVNYETKKGKAIPVTGRGGP
jgi:hypothetical protein